MRVPLILFMLSLLGLIVPKSSAEPSMPASGPAAAEVPGPASLTARAGDVLVRIDGPKLWTLSRIEYRGTVLAIEDSAYGTVVSIHGVGHLGSAHFLDKPGRPGEVEKEQVTRLGFFVDDKPLPGPLPQTLSVEGSSFRFERDSRMRAFALQSKLEVRDDRVIQSVRVRTDQAVDLDQMYPLMYAWTASASAYLFGGDDGTVKGGEFLRRAEDAEGGRQYLFEKEATRWAAVYDPTSRKGTVSYVVERPDQGGNWWGFADCPGVYRKLYLKCFAESTIPAGFDGTYKIVIGFFDSDEAGWKTKAEQLAATLRKGSY